MYTTIVHFLTQNVQNNSDKYWRITSYKVIDSYTTFNSLLNSPIFSMPYTSSRCPTTEAPEHILVKNHMVSAVLILERSHILTKIRIKI